MASRYAKASSDFWTRGSGRRLRGNAHAQALGQYLLSGPHSNALGLYRVSIPMIAHDLGWTIRQVAKTMRVVVDSGFANFDELEGVVHVLNVFRYEFGEIKPEDNRLKYILGIVNDMKDHEFCKMFCRNAMLYDEKTQAPYQAPLLAASAGASEAPQQAISIKQEALSKKQLSESIAHNSERARASDFNPFEDAPQSTQTIKTSDGSGHTANAPPTPPKPISNPAPVRIRSEREDDSLSIAMICAEFSAARQRVGGGHGPSRPSLKHHDLFVGALDTFRDAADAEGVKPVEIVRRSADGFCADRWAREHGWPVAAWLPDPGKYLVKKDPRALATSQDFTNEAVSLEELGVMFEKAAKK